MISSKSGYRDLRFRQEIRPKIFAAQEEAAHYVAALTANNPTDPSARTGEEQARWLLAQILNWHRREAKSEWWAYFERRSKTEPELIPPGRGLFVKKQPKVLVEHHEGGLSRQEFDPHATILDRPTIGNGGVVHTWKELIEWLGSFGDVSGGIATMAWLATRLRRLGKREKAVAIRSEAGRTA